jgi:hypothetical protein
MNNKNPIHILVIERGRMFGKDIYRCPDDSLTGCAIDLLVCSLSDYLIFPYIFLNRDN